MSLTYRLMYAVGFKPWDSMITDELKELVAELPPGRVLDLGMGMGGKAVYFAQHGWRVTGIENVPKALKEARRRQAAAGVQLEIRDGDVTRLDDLRLQPGYDLFWDFGCFHGLSDEQKKDYVHGVDHLAKPGSILQMMAFVKSRPPLPRAVTQDELKAAFSGWQLLWQHSQRSLDARTGPAEAGWFRFVKS
jgi:cyclopropane fatty-acyl-phospholipid synthase-like methyltransferase